MGALLALLPAAGHDQLWFLLVAHRWLAGATLYGPAVFDSNTPAVVWLSALPDLLGHALHLPLLLIPALAKLFVLALDLLVAFLCAQLLRRLAPTLPRVTLLWLACAFALLTLAIPARDFGQRDALTAVLLLPYLLAAACSRRTLAALAPLRFSAALLAALGLCLKPQQTLVPLLIESTLLVLALRPHHPMPGTSAALHADDRPLPLFRRPEPLILLAAGLLFLAAVHHLTPLFFTLTLPTLLDTYWAVGGLSPLQLLAEAPQLTALAVLTTALVLYTRRQTATTPQAALQTDLRRPTTLLLLAGLAATAAYFVQGTGWYYQQLPAITLVGAALALTLIPLAARLTPPRWLPRATAALGLLAVALTIIFGGLPLRRSAAYATPVPDPTLFESLPPHTPIAILTTSVEDTMMPTWRFDLTWAQRTNNLWTLPAVLRNLDPRHPPPPHHRLAPARLDQLAAQQRQWMVEDLLRWHPTLLLIQRCQDPAVPCQELGPLHPDLLAFFLADPAFRLLFQAHYRPLRHTPDYDAYTLFTPF